MKTLEKIKWIIVNELDLDIKIEDIHENDSLYEDGLCLDSIAIIDLIVAMEKKFNLNFKDNELKSDYFNNLKTLSDFIEFKLNNN